MSQECVINPVSSRACERGTKSCVVHHTTGPVADQAAPYWRLKETGYLYRIKFTSLSLTGTPLITYQQVSAPDRLYTILADEFHDGRFEQIWSLHNMPPSPFKIEQIALCPPDPEAAMQLLTQLGLTDWVHDTVVASGRITGKLASNQAQLHFNYQASPEGEKPLELEVLHYEQGRNWMQKHPHSVSHLGVHCTPGELSEWRKIFEEQNIAPVQEVFTESHTNPAIAGRRYQYVIFGTRPILGVDLKFIVRYSSV